MPLLFMLLLGSGLFAQQKDDDIPIFKAEVSLIKVDIEVTEPGGRNLSDFRKDDFVVLDENQPQSIVHFERESEPLDLLLLLDISGSMRRSLEQVAAATRAALAQLHPGDRVALMMFSRRAEIIQPFTSDLTGVQYKILDSIYKQNLGSGTLINESLIAAAGVMKQQPPKGRRAILMVTDAEGLNYRSPDAEVVRAMLGSDTVLNAIIVRQGPRPPATRRTGYTNPDFTPPNVSKMAAQTGGETVDGVGNVSELFRRMVEGIRARYFVQYSGPSAEPGVFRHIRVDLSPAARSRHPGAIVRAREGYYVSHSQ